MIADIAHTLDMGMKNDSEKNIVFDLHSELAKQYGLIKIEKSEIANRVIRMIRFLKNGSEITHDDIVELSKIAKIDAFDESKRMYQYQRSLFDWNSNIIVASLKGRKWTLKPKTSCNFTLFFSA